MADKAKNTSKAAKPKRRLRSTPTIREQVALNADDTKVSKKSVVKKVLSAPFRFAKNVIVRISRLIAKSFIGVFAVKLWKSKLFIPVRFIVKIIAKVLFISYFKKSWEELRLVTWPNTNTTVRLTFAVIMFAFVFGFIVAGMDFVFEKLFREVILK